MGTALGLLLGFGLLLIVTAERRDRAAASSGFRARLRGLDDLISQAGLEGVRPAGVIGSCIGSGAVTFLVFLALSRTVTVAAAFGVFASYAPVALVRLRARRRRHELRDVWPDAVDNLASAVRAGLSLPETLAQLGVRGPEPLRRPFALFGEDYRATGRFDESLTKLKAALADPVGDRVVESLRIARDVGGSDLGRVLRTLSAFLRDDARTRAEVEARQSWTINGARLAVAAPWLLLAMLSLRSEAIRAYDSRSGATVLVGGALVCVLAYRLMVRLGRLPEERRVLR